MEGMCKLINALFQVQASVTQVSRMRREGLHTRPPLPEPLGNTTLRSCVAKHGRRSRRSRATASAGLP